MCVAIRVTLVIREVGSTTKFNFDEVRHEYKYTDPPRRESERVGTLTGVSAKLTGSHNGSTYINITSHIIISTSNAHAIAVVTFHSGGL